MDHQDQEVPPEPSFSDVNHEPPRQFYFDSEEEMMREFNALPPLFRTASVAGGLTKLAEAMQESNRDHNALQSRMLNALDQILAYASTLPNQPTAPLAAFPAVDPNPPAPVQAPRARTQPLQTPVEAPQPTGVQPPEFTFQALGRLDAANIGTLRLTRRASSLEDQDPMMLLAGSASDTSFTAQTPPVQPVQRTPPARNAQQLPTPLVTPVLDTSGVTPSATRRMSITDRIIVGSSALADATQTQVVLRPPQHHISLKRLTARDILQFLFQLTDYQYAHRIPLHAASLVDPPLVRQLIARHPQLNHASFQALNNHEVYQLLQFDSMPHTLFDAYNRLDAAIKFPLSLEKYRPSPTDFYPFYSALLAYKREFTMAYDLITGQLPPHLLPPLSTKDYGTLKLFLSKIPFSYGHRIHAAYLQRLVSSNPRDTSDPTRITTLQGYLHAFYKYVDVHFHLYRDARSMGQLFGGSEFHGGSNRDRPRNAVPSRPQRLQAVLPVEDSSFPVPNTQDEDSLDGSQADDSDPELPPDEFDEPFFDTDFSPLPNLDADAVDDATLYKSHDDRLSSAEFSDPAIPLDEHPFSVHAISPDPAQRPRDPRSSRDSPGSFRKPPGLRPRSPPPTSTDPAREARRYSHRSTPDQRFPPPNPHSKTSSPSTYSFPKPSFPQGQKG